VNVVHLTWGIPWPPTSGARIRDEALIRRVAALGGRVALVCFAKDEKEIPDLDPLRSICESVDVFRPPKDSVPATIARVAGSLRAGRPLAMQEFYFPELAALVRRRLIETNAQIFQIEHSLMSAYVECKSGLSDVRTVLSLHNLGWVQYRRLAELPGSLPKRGVARLKAVAMSGWEAKWAARFDLCLTVSETDRRLLLEKNPHLRVADIPNPLDTVALRPLPRKQSARFLFTGVLSYAPNADGVLYFCRHVSPALRRRVPGARLMVAGTGAPPELRRMAGDSLELLGEVPDLRPVYAECRAAVVPLRAGGGTRLKILEAFALGCPVVSTPVGCEGIPAVHGRHLLVAGSPGEFARSLEELVNDDALCARLAANARDLVQREFSADLVGARLFREYEKLSGVYAGSLDRE